MIAITRRYHFSASHRLHSPELSDAENARIYGKCNNPYGHGHDYTLEVTVSGPADPKTGRIVALEDLDALVSEQVLSLFSGRNLNLDVPQFQSLVASTENIVLVIRDLLLANWNSYLGRGAARLSRVHVQETARNSFEIAIAAHSERTESKYKLESEYVSR